MVRKFAFILLSAALISTAHAEPLRQVSIGVMAELSGPFASIGEDCRRGYELAEKKLTNNGTVGAYSVKLIYGDHQRDPKTGVSEFNRLTNQEHVLTISSNASSVVMAINPTAKARKLPLLGVSAHPDFVTNNEYGFRFWLNANVEGGGLAKKALAMHVKNVAVITLEDDYPLAVSKGFITTFKNGGGIIATDEHVLKTDTDFAPVISRLRRVNPDAIFLNVVGDQFPTIIKKLREQGLKQQLFGSFSTAKKEYIDSAGHENIEGTLFLEINGEKPKFMHALKEAYGVALPTGLHYTCYAAVAFFIDALKRDPNIRSSADLYKAFLKMNSVDLLDGPLAIANREAQFDYILRIVKNGQVLDDTNE